MALRQPIGTTDIDRSQRFTLRPHRLPRPLIHASLSERRHAREWSSPGTGVVEPALTAVLARLLAFVAWNARSIIRLQRAVHFAFLAVLLDDPVVGLLQTRIV